MTLHCLNPHTRRRDERRRYPPPTPRGASPDALQVDRTLFRHSIGLVYSFAGVVSENDAANDTKGADRVELQDCR